ncbi:ubiquinol oxidase subunit II [Sphingomonas sp. MMS24-J13]|uniref:ubiquinol oxidase subunit II n=1 Tax=Sphingomonas sp. MMS24-J13 TaxID=3238686 RepID=UPI00384F5B1F
MLHRRIDRILPFLPLALLAGCKMEVLNPAGDVARQQANLLIVSTILMLLIIIPVMALTVLFAWRYRAANKAAEHRPDWDHSTALELVIWSAPLLIIIMLGAITWISTHTLDPYRRLGRIAPGQMIPANAKPLEIEVVALDWKWLFIYPEQGVATVNKLVLPVNREVRFRITSSAVMNSFYVPALAGQIYAMPAMETKLHAVLNKPGTFEGFSANYSGAGFSGMHFPTIGVDNAGFDSWVAQAKAAGGALDRDAYLKLAEPSENVPAQSWASVDTRLFDQITTMCVTPGPQCMQTWGHGEKPMHDMPMTPSPLPADDASRHTSAPPHHG